MLRMSQPFTPAAQTATAWSSRAMYFSLLHPTGWSKGRADSAGFLTAQLQATRQAQTEMPLQAHLLAPWLLAQQAHLQGQFDRYVARRKAGDGPWLFSSLAHAQYFLRVAAPTAMVDGAWLYGLTRHSQDTRLSGLLDDYLHRIGNGYAARNRVAIYQRLLQQQGIEDWKTLDDALFTQGAVQLALAANTDRFLPELLGFHLGQQLGSVDQRIAAYELKAWQVDSRYFEQATAPQAGLTAAAQAAIAAIQACLPTQEADSNAHLAFMYRVRAGLQLCQAGVSLRALIDQFDLTAEMIRVCQQKAQRGQLLARQSATIEGRSLADWLSQPALMSRFLHVLQKVGWIKRHQAPHNSLFWQSVVGPKAATIGVFSRYERQVLFEWIAGDALAQLPAQQRLGTPRTPQFEAANQRHQPTRSNVFDLRTGRALPLSGRQPAFEEDMRALQRYLQGLGDQRMAFMLDWLSPAKHHTPLGLNVASVFQALRQPVFHAPATTAVLRTST